MARRDQGRGRGRPPQRRRPSAGPGRQAPSHDPLIDGPEDSTLQQGLRTALRSGDPLEFLVIVSGFLEVTDPRSRDPLDRTEPAFDISLLVDSLVGVPFAETTAALTALKALTPDEFLSARIERALQARRHPLPGWLTGLGDARIDPDVWFMTHVLGDGDNYLLGVTLPTGQALTALVYVDHNMGTVVKDAFVIPETLEDVVIRMGTLSKDPDQTLTRTDPADARAAIEAAIDSASHLYPPLTTDTWPMCRPLVEWMLRLLPADGEAPERKEWSPEETAAIAQEFFASPFGRELDRPDERDLLDSVLWFGTGYSTGDPWRWSPVTVEILLTDFMPRKVIADRAYLAKLPGLLRAYIRYCHDRNGIRASLTAETLGAVARHEKQYLKAIRDQGAHPLAGLAEALINAERIKHLSDEEILLEYIAADVGGMDALQALDDEPLADEAFQWAGIREDIRPAVQAILDQCDACADALLDVEHRTAMRRLLARAARNDPNLFRRKGSPARGAAAVAWAICTANRTAGARGTALSAKDLLAHFGISGTVADRAQSLVRAAGVDVTVSTDVQRLGDPGLLVSTRRRQLIAQRDRALEQG